MKKTAPVVARYERRAIHPSDYVDYFTHHPKDRFAAAFRDGYGPAQMTNNCYSFALDSRTGHLPFASPAPGAASGIWFDITRIGDGDYVQRLAEKDGVRPLAEDALPPAGFYRVALFTDPGHEFHWYRETAPGIWYHKRGHLAVTGRDAAGRPIGDPRYADRDYRQVGGRNYTHFQGFFIVPKGGINLETPTARNQHPENGNQDFIKVLDKLIAARQSALSGTMP